MLYDTLTVTNEEEMIDWLHNFMWGLICCNISVGGIFLLQWTGVIHYVS